MSNEILPFCPNDTGTNLPLQADYLASATRTSGAVPGVASSQYNNKPMRQATFIASQVAQFLANNKSVNILDDGDTTKLLGVITAAFTKYAPITTKYHASATGTHLLTYIFQITSGSATAAATYTNNTQTFTVVSTIASGTTLICKGTGAPAVAGTLTKATGTGDATLTFHAYTKPLAVRARGVGAGGGGAGSGTSSGGGNGGNGTDTTVGSAFLTGQGGRGGVAGGAGGAGGTATNSTGLDGIAVSGGGGAASQGTGTGDSVISSGVGGSSMFGGGAKAVVQSGAGQAGATDTGGGGSGGGQGGVSTGVTGAGGGAGGGFDILLTTPVATGYAYNCGTGGTAGTAGSGTGAAVGGAGGDGFVEFTEYFQ